MKPYDTELSKKEEVRAMFDNIAPAYDRLNHTLSLSVDRIWRRRVVRIVGRLHPRRVLDMATGTGDLAVMMARSIPEAHIKGVDLSEGMLDVARRKVAARGLEERVTLEAGDAETAVAAAGSVDVVTVAFGVRNFGDLGRGLAELSRALRPGGTLVYSTCTFNRDENEEIVSRLVSRYGAEPVDLSPDPAWGIIGGVETDIPCYHLLPGRVEGEGQFMAVLRKPSDTSSPSERSGRRHKPTPRQAKADPRAAEWLSDSALASMTHTVDGDRINAFTTQWLPLLERLSDRKMPDIIHHGTPVASVKGRDLVPSHALAMATGIVSDSAFSRVETDVDTALQYLRGEAVSVDAPRGHVMLTYGGLPLGFVKNLGNRANNMYPRDWRIRHM